MSEAIETCLRWLYIIQCDGRASFHNARVLASTEGHQPETVFFTTALTTFRFLSSLGLRRSSTGRRTSCGPFSRGRLRRGCGSGCSRSGSRSRQAFFGRVFLQAGGVWFLRRFLSIGILYYWYSLGNHNKKKHHLECVLTVKCDIHV